jgi:hypothetical protein
MHPHLTQTQLKAFVALGILALAASACGTATVSAPAATTMPAVTSVSMPAVTNVSTATTPPLASLGANPVETNLNRCGVRLVCWWRYSGMGKRHCIWPLTK